MILKRFCFGAISSFFLLSSLNASSPKPSKIVLLSFDGISTAQFSPTTMPKTWSLMKKIGTYGSAVPPTPSMTFPSHVSIATGVYPNRHGVVANSFIDPVLGKVQSSAFVEYLNEEPLWVLTTKNKLRTAVYHWPTATGPWRKVAPEVYKIYDKKVSDQENFNRCLNGLRSGIDVVIGYMSGTDTEGHRFGPDSQEVLDKLRMTDDLTYEFLNTVITEFPHAVVVLTSDHGMNEPKTKLNLYAYLDSFKVDIFTFGGSAFIYSANKSDIPALLQKLNKNPNLKAWAKAEIPQQYHLDGNDRVGDIFVLSDLSIWLSSAKNEMESFVEIQGRTGAHSYDSDLPIMHSFFVVFGKGKKPVGTIQNVDIAPTIASWLNLKWESKRDGRIIDALK